MDEIKILEALNKIEVRLASIEVDLRHHISRSDKHEELLGKQSKVIISLLIGAALTAGAGAKVILPYVLKLF
jgi:hypothetical protein